MSLDTLFDLTVYWGIDPSRIYGVAVDLIQEFVRVDA
jgi:hypothetical protein